MLPFTEEFSRWPAERFMAEVLRDGLHAEHCVMGANFTFGHMAMGNVQLLIDEGAGFGFSAERVELHELDGRIVVVVVDPRGARRGRPRLAAGGARIAGSSWTGSS